MPSNNVLIGVVTKHKLNKSSVTSKTQYFFFFFSPRKVGVGREECKNQNKWVYFLWDLCYR